MKYTAPFVSLSHICSPQLLLPFPLHIPSLLPSYLGLPSSPRMQVTGATSPFAFNQAWVTQMKDGALVAALVALAYPDRLAR